MSSKLTGMVLDHFHGDPLAKLVFLTLADRADERGICWPSRADLSARSGASTATVGRKLRELERLGWIARKARFQSSAVFRVNVQRLLDFAALAQRIERIPEGFEPFPEEVAKKAAQAIEIANEDHSDRKNDHSDRKNDRLGDHLTVNNLSKNKAPAAGLLLSSKEWAEYQSTARPGETRADWAQRVRGGSKA